MPSRRFHHKSRHGCTNCKQRKIRCAEERPTCANCNRLGGRCSFLDSDPTGGPLVNSSPESSTGTPQASGASVHTPEGKTENLEQYDEELIRRWSEATCFTMNDRLEAISMWQVTVPALASNYPFLRHGLLALSSMHLRYTSPLPLQSRYLDLASEHQGYALAGYIPALRTITPENCHPLFGFSALLLSIQYSFIAAMDDEVEHEEVLNEVTSVFDYVIGATVIAHQARDWLPQGSLRRLMSRRSQPSNILDQLLQGPQDALRNLTAYVNQLAGAPKVDLNNEISNRVAIYMHSIDMLTNAFPKQDAVHRVFDDMIGWPHFVGGGLLRLLKDRDPVTLVILAHYGVALSAFNDCWWLEGVGARLIRAVASVLDLSFFTLIDWPVSMITEDQVGQQLFVI